MKTMTAVVALAALAGSASASITYIGSFGGKDYYRNDTLLSYTNARSVAEGLFAGQSYLLAINSAAEQAWLNATIGHITNSGPVFWLGLNKAGNPNGGQAALNTWDSGEAVTYTNWNGDAVFNDPTRNYASWNWNAGGGWQLLSDTGSPFGLKRSIIEVPAPGALSLIGLAGLAAARRRRA